jgi:hypothetical protein
MVHFNQKLCHELNSLKIPTFWSEEAESLLIKNKDKFESIISQTQKTAKSYAADKNIQLGDLIPTGFLIGLGIAGSGNYIAGLGASALLTLIVVPLEVECFDKISRQTNTYYEASWAIGGFGQTGIGVGEGVGVAARGAVGMIWGTLNEAKELNGPAVGITANFSALYGIGIKAALLYNMSTRSDNLIVMATLDVGTSATTSVSASIFYFMTANQLIEYMFGGLGTVQGTDTVQENELSQINTSS